MVDAATEAGRRGQGVLAMLAFGAIALLTVALAGSAGTGARSRVALISSIRLTDDDGDHALFAAADLGPGTSLTRCLRVTYSGPGGTGPVRLVAGDLSGTLLAHLTVRVEVGTGGDFGGCGGFSGSVLYAGALTGLGGGTPEAPGAPTDWDPQPDSARTFQITVSVDDAATPGQTADGTFQWLAPADVPTSSPTPAAPSMSAPLPPSGPPAPSSPAAAAAPPTHRSAVPAPRKGARAAPGVGRTWIAGQLKQLFHAGLVVTAHLVRHGELPVGWLVVMTGFLAVQDRIDRRDPKLALAPVWRETDLPFPGPESDDTEGGTP